MNTRVTDRLMKVIADNVHLASCGIYFTRNIAGDPMNTIFCEDGVMVDICIPYEYFEVFGLTENEQNIIEDFYDTIADGVEEPRE